MGDTRKRSFWGWGWEDKFPDASARKAMAEHAQLMLGFAPKRLDEPPALESIQLSRARLSPPGSLAHSISDDHEDARPAYLWSQLPRRDAWLQG